MTYIVRFIYNRRFNFYNVEEAEDGLIDIEDGEQEQNKQSPNIKIEDIEFRQKGYQSEEDEQGIRSSGHEQINSFTQKPDYAASINSTGTQP